MDFSEYLTAQFYLWEIRGRGWKAFAEPVELESEFIPFFGHLPPHEPERRDSGRRPRFFPKIQEALGLFTPPPLTNIEDQYEKLEELYPIHSFVYDNPNPVKEYQIKFDKDTRVTYDYIEQLLLMLSTSKGIVAFEIFGDGEKITVQFVCTSEDVQSFKAHIEAYAPGVIVSFGVETLASKVMNDKETNIVDLALRDEFMRPLRTWMKYEPDPLGGIFGILESLEHGEFGMLQILFQPAINPWPESIMRAVNDGSGKSFFSNSPEMLSFARDKTSSPLFAVVVRTMSQAYTDERSKAISTKLAQSLYTYHRPGSNTFIPMRGAVSCDGDDIVMRRSRRIGMILNTTELAGLVHIPDRSILSPKLRAYTGKTKKAPKEVLGHPFELGTNTHMGANLPVTLSVQHRLRHMHIIGATGTGKSTLLLKMIVQDIEQGSGCAILDPHGDLIEEILKHVPKVRVKDIVLVDPSDIDYPIGLNLLSAQTDAEKLVLSSDMVALFKRFATSWGDQMTSVLSNAINAILESDTGGTLLDLRRFLVEASFRNKFLESVHDPNILYYWKNEFKLLKATTVAPIPTRLDTFLRPRIVRNMMAQKSGLDFREIMDSQKILLVKLSQGLIGEENSYLLGTLFVAKLHQGAQSRQNVTLAERNPYYLYIDEFQNFTTPSMSAILSGARKYGLGLILAHQDIDQLAFKDIQLANSVLSNPSIRICFRCGDNDASKMESGFSYFDSTDLQNQPIGSAIVRVGQKDHDFNVAFAQIVPADSVTAVYGHKAIVENCRKTYGVPKDQVEALIKESLNLIQVQRPIEQLKKEEPNEKLVQTIEEVIEEKPKLDIEAESKLFVAKETEKEKQREHRYIQEFVKKIAEARNFKAVLEEPINDYSGKVDVSLHRDELRIACEISVFNTIQYEVQNIQKCLIAGFSLVFMISNDPVHLNAIRSLADAEIAPAMHHLIIFVSKDEFVVELDLLLAKMQQPVETRSKGYRVKVNYNSLKDKVSQHNALKGIILSSILRDEKPK